jgi:hypothetical protein
MSKERRSRAMTHARAWLSLCLAVLLAVAAVLAPGGVWGCDRGGAANAGLAGSSNVWFVGQLGGVTYGVAVEGSLAYVGEGRGLTILDISDTTRRAGPRKWISPVTISTSPTIPAVCSSCASEGSQ